MISEGRIEDVEAHSMGFKGAQRPQEFNDHLDSNDLKGMKRAQ